MMQWYVKDRRRWPHAEDDDGEEEELRVGTLETETSERIASLVWVVVGFR